MLTFRKFRPCIELGEVEISGFLFDTNGDLTGYLLNEQENMAVVFLLKNNQIQILSTVDLYYHHVISWQSNPKVKPNFWTSVDED